MANSNETLSIKESDDDDLEDGEIESDDGENDTSSSAINQTQLAVTKTNEKKSCEENNSYASVVDLTSPEKVKNQEKSPSNSSSFDSEKKSKKPQSFDDDFAGNIENAIAAVLKKDGIEPLPLPKLGKRHDGHDPQHEKLTDDQQQTRSKGKKRKRRDNDDVKKKKRAKLREEQNAEANDDVDDYEMLCVRGGSPPSQPRPEEHNNMSPYPPPQSYPSNYYESDDSYSSYNSYDSGEHRKEKRHSKRKNRDHKSHKAGRSGRERRRNRADSDGDDNPKHDKYVGPRQMELCKFYLMECCAKREKCLYMHGDFPCKYYYLGMECVYKNSCKFSHGEPLTDELRNILLKHIETAPKEILGNFRRMSRENATIMMNQTHAKLCAEKGIENTFSTTLPQIENYERPVNSPSRHKPTNTVTNNKTIGIPSLLDMVINPPNVSPRKDDKDKQNKAEKPRKSRWCDNNSSTKKNQNLMSIPPPNMLPNPVVPSLMQINTGLPPPPVVNRSVPPPSTLKSSILSLQNLSGVLSPEQIEKLSAIGVETVEQINNLTVAQLNELGLSIGQIHEIQLNALNIQKLGLISKNNNKSNSFGTTPAIPESKPTNPVNVEQSTVESNVTKDDSSAEDNKTKLSTQDIDMRCISSGGYSPLDVPSATPKLEGSDNVNSSDTTMAEVGIASPDPIPSSVPATQETDKTNNVFEKELQNITPTPVGGAVDFSQYLRDSHLDAEKDINLNNLLDKDDVLIEDEPTLQIDESWCPSEDENSKNETLSKESDTELTMDCDNTTDTETKADIDSEKNPCLEPMAYDFKMFLPFYSNKPETKLDKNESSNIEDTSCINKKADLQVKSEPTDIITEKPEIVNPINNPPQYRTDPRISSFLHKQKQDDDSGSLDHNEDKNERSVYQLHTNDSKEDDFKILESKDKSAKEDEKEQNTPLYNRTSIYDGTSIVDDEGSSKKADKDMRMSLFLNQFSDSANSDIDLRLPFKPVMANYTPASEIDGSIGSHAPITYKLVEVDVPRPDYSEIRRSFPVTEKTLDPRLRRIFCLKESVTDLNENSDSELIAFSTKIPEIKSSDLISTSSTFSLGTTPLGATSPALNPHVPPVPSGPRIDPRRRKEQDSLGGSTAVPVTSDNKSNQSVNLHLLLQKSEWYKNLSSKNKIMVNQQLAMLSSEIKKFHADPTPNKIFDMNVIGSNQNLQQILEQLGVYVDSNTNIRQLSDFDNETNETGAQSKPKSLLGLMNMFDSSQNTGGIPPMPIDYLVGASQMNMNRHFMGNAPPFGGIFNDVKPGLLGIAPGIQFNVNEMGFMSNPNFGGNDNRQGGMNSGGGNNGGGGNRNNRNFRQSNNRNSGNDRRSGNSNSGGRNNNNNNNRRNFDNRRNSNRDNRREKQS